MNLPPSSQNPLAHGPYVSPVDVTEDVSNSCTAGRDAYNIVSDTVVGVNVRKSDNLFQLKVILICVLLGVPIGVIAAALLSDPNDRLVAALAGGLGMGFVGMVVGLFGSGIYLMVYRAVRHVKGQHD